MSAPSATPRTPSSPLLTPAQLRQAIDALPRYPLAHLPTPLEPLPRLSRQLGGPPVFIKRDDCTGLAFGGNKARHNEFLIGRALAQQCDIVVWGAGVQSNNCRQTAAACAKAGLECHLILGRGDVPEGSSEVQGNLLLDYLLGARVDIVDAPLGPALDDLIAAQAAKYRAAGRRPFTWDREQLKPLAAVSYALCYLEILEQAQHLGVMPEALYVCSAGSTGAGLVLARAALGQSLPIRHVAPIRWPWDTQADMARIAREAGRLLSLDLPIRPEDVDVTFDYIAPGYGRVSPDGLAAIRLLARTEGILLDPIYSGKALAALLAEQGSPAPRAAGPVVFIHTGGTPALFAYHRDLV